MRLIFAFPGTGRRDYVARYPNVQFFDPEISQPGQSRQAVCDMRAFLRPRLAADQFTVITAHPRLIAQAEFMQENYVLVYPDSSLRDEYYQRLLSAPEPDGGETYANFIRSSWLYWLWQLTNKAHPRHLVVLKSGELIADRLPFHQNPDYLEGLTLYDKTDVSCTG